MVDQLLREWQELSVTEAAECTGEQAAALWSALVEFPATESPLVLRASVVPSATTRMMAAFRKIDADCNLQAHAGNGTVIARFSVFPEDGLSLAMQRLAIIDMDGGRQPMATADGRYTICLLYTSPSPRD